jgi:TatD DNase family protein
MLIDAHSHLDLYEEALEPALQEIRQHSIFTVSNSLGLESYQHNLDIAGQCDWVLPIFGVHPWFAPQHADRLEDLGAAIEQSSMLGEIGLDYYFVEDASQYPAQRKVFEFFLQAAAEQGKIVHLHTKGAEQEVLELLDRHGVERAVVHWYSGPLDILKQWKARGAYFTVGIEVRYSPHIQEIARQVPAEQLLTETDNPGGPKSLIGGLGMPSLIQDVVQELAAVRSTTAEAIVQSVHANFRQLIGDDPRLSSAQAMLSLDILDSQAGCEPKGCG